MADGENVVQFGREGTPGHAPTQTAPDRLTDSWSGPGRKEYVLDYSSKVEAHRKKTFHFTLTGTKQDPIISVTDLSGEVWVMDGDAFLNGINELATKRFLLPDGPRSGEPIVDFDDMPF